jgi:peroxiredoxin
MVARYRDISYLIAINAVVLSTLSVIAQAENSSDGGGNTWQTNPLDSNMVAITPRGLLKKCAEYLESLPPYAMHTDTQRQNDSGAGELLVYDQRWDGVQIDVAWKQYAVTGDHKRLEWDKRGIWTGKQFQWRQQSFPPDPQEPDRVRPGASLDYARGERLLTSTHSGGFLCGILLGDKRNVGRVLAESDELKLEEQTETVGGYACYVIEGQTPSGYYKAWIDPAHGFNVTKARVTKKSGDLYFGKPIGTTGTANERKFAGCRVELNNVRIEEIGGRYVPVSGALTHTLKYSDGTTKQARWASKRSNIQFNPDFKAMGAFVMDGIPDAATTRMEETPDLQYVWSNGEFVLDDSYNSRDRPGREPRASPTQVGDKVPSFYVVTTDGSRISTTEAEGKVLVLNFFTTWCSACKKEIPHFESEVWKRSKDRGLIAVCVGIGYSDEEIRQFKADEGYDVPMASDPQKEIYKDYATGYIPRNVVVGRDGRIKYLSTGFNDDILAQMTKVIEEQLQP